MNYQFANAGTARLDTGVSVMGNGATTSVPGHVGGRCADRGRGFHPTLACHAQNFISPFQVAALQGCHSCSSEAQQPNFQAAHAHLKSGSGAYSLIYVIKWK